MKKEIVTMAARIIMKFGDVACKSSVIAGLYDPPIPQALKKDNSAIKESVK